MLIHSYPAAAAADALQALAAYPAAAPQLLVHWRLAAAAPQLLVHTHRAAADMG